MRFQSGLGSEFSRIYKEGTRVDQLILAQVLKVNYRYNTVDIITMRDHNVIGGAYDNEGKFSAKLPIEFGGRTQQGLPYGQINPVAVGSIVLVGFVNENKEMPIVLSVYNNSEVSEQLARAPFSSADPQDEELARDMYHKFTLYPSLIYDSVNGDGDRVVTFSGRSFISFSSNDTRNSNMTDDNYGSDYFDMESSYYGNGDPIEPVGENAPNILFRHQGIFDKDDEFDNHKLMIHINNEGTYRTSMLDQTEDWRTMFEMTPEGDIKLRRQGDSLSVGDGFEVGEIGIDKRGKVYMRNGSTEMTLEEDGIYTNGEPLSVNLDDVWDGIENANGGILENSQNIENVGDKLSITSGLVTQQGKKLTDMSSEITIMAEEISSRVTKSEVEDILDAGLEDISDDIQDAKRDANRANKTIEEIVEDNYVDMDEKTILASEWDLIKNEYPSYMQQASNLEVGSNDYKKAYEELEDTVQPILEDMNSSTAVDGVIVKNRFEGYYGSRTELLQDFLGNLKEGIQEAMRQANRAALDASDAQGAAIEAQRSADKVSSLVSDIADDEKLTPNEKIQLRREWNTIQREYPTTLEQAEKYSVGTNEYQNRYSQLKSFLEPLLQDMDMTTNVNGEELSNVLTNYYDSRVKLMKEITDNARDILDEYGERINTAETNIRQTSEQIELVATRVESVEEDLVTQKASIDILSDQIELRVTEDEAKGIIKESMDDLKIGTSNLYVISTQTEGILNDDNGEVEQAEDGSVVSNWVSVRPSYPYVASLYENPDSQANIITVNYYNSDREFLSGKSLAEVGDFYMEAPSPANASFARVSYKYASNVRIKFESGSKPTDWSLSWDDVMYDQDLLEEYIKDVEDQAAEAQRSAENAQNDADVSNRQIADIGDDDKVTSGEKKQLKLQWEEIEAEYPEIHDQATRYELSFTSYTNAYDSVKSYLEDLFEDMNETSNISGETLRATFSRYYGAKTTLLNQVYSKAEQNAKDYSDTEIAKVGKRIQQAEDQIDESNKILVDMSKDDVLSPIDKKSLSKEWEQIQSEYPKLIDQGNKYGTNVRDLEASYGILDRYLLPILGTMGDNSEIDVREFRRTFKDYYDDKLTLMNEISDEVRKLGDAAAEDAENNAKTYTDNSIEVTKEGIELGYHEYTDGAVGAAEKRNNEAIEEANSLIEKAQKSADSANESIKDLSKDGILSPIDKKSLAKEWEQIESEYPKLIGQANSYSVSTSGLETAYTSLKNYVEPLLLAMGDNSGIDSQEFRLTFKDYYGDKLTLMNSVSDEVRKLGDAAAENAENNAKDYSDTEIAKVGKRIQQAEDQIDESNKILVDMSKDDVLSPIDKKSLSKEWEQIESEYPKLVEQGNKYGVNITDLEASYGALERYLQPILSQMGENTEINSKEFRSKFKEYYDDKLALMNSVSDEVRKLGDAAASDAENRAKDYSDTSSDRAEQNAKNYADSSSNKAEQNAKVYTDNQIDITKDGIKLSVEETKEYADSSSNKAEQNAKDYSDTRSDKAEQNAKEYADSSSNKAEQNAKDYSDTEIAKVGERIQQAEDQIDESNKILVDLSKDDILSPIDKKSLAKEWEQIESEYPKLIGQANSYSVSTSGLETAYTSLKNYVEPLLLAMGDNSGIDSQEFREMFKNYYDDKLTLMNNISDEVRKLGDAAAEKAENNAKTYTDNSIEITRDGILGRVEEVKKRSDASANSAREDAIEYTKGQISLTKDEFDVNFVKNDELISAFNINQSGLSLKGDTIELDGDIVLNKINASMKASYSYGPPSWGGWDRYFEGIWDLNSNELRFESDTFELKDGGKGDFIGHGKTYFSADQIKLREYTDGSEGDVHGDLMSRLDISGFNLQFARDWNTDSGVILNSDGEGMFNKQIWVGGGAFFGGDVAMPQHLLNSRIEPRDDWNTWRLNENFIGGIPRIFFSNKSPFARIEVPWDYSGGNSAGEPYGYRLGKDSTSGFYQIVHGYSRTYSGSGNAQITSNGVLGRATSASKYKLNITPLEEEESLSLGDNLLTLSPTKWWDKTETEEYAEEFTSDAYFEDNSTVKPHYGLIAEDLRDAGLDQYIEYNEMTQEIEGIEYSRLWTVLLPVIRRQSEDIEELKRKISILESRGS